MFCESSLLFMIDLKTKQNYQPKKKNIPLVTMQTRQDHISDLLTAIPSAALRNESTIDVGLRLASGKILTLRAELGQDFPQLPPTLKILDNGVTHPWLDSLGKVVGLNKLYNWNPRSSTLVDVVNTALTEFCIRPPQLNNNNNNNNNGSSVYINNGTTNTSRPPPPNSSSTTTNRTNSNNKLNINNSFHDDNDEVQELDLPPIPASFPELQTMTSLQLQGLLDNDRTYHDFFNTLEYVSGPTSFVESIRHGNIDTAKKNLERKIEIDSLKNRIETTRESINKTRRDFQSLVTANAKITQRLAPTRLVEELEQLAKSIDAESEEIATSFGTTEDLDATIDKFRKLRIIYHLRMAKAERLKATISE
jgi:hypothetical protein